MRAKSRNCVEKSRVWLWNKMNWLFLLWIIDWKTIFIIVCVRNERTRKFEYSCYIIYYGFVNYDDRLCFTNGLVFIRKYINTYIILHVWITLIIIVPSRCRQVFLYNGILFITVCTLYTLPTKRYHFFVS